MYLCSMRQEWSGFLNWLHNELSDSKEKVNVLEKELNQSQETVLTLQVKLTIVQIVKSVNFIPRVSMKLLSANSTMNYVRRTHNY